ncbi:carbonic anhydrase 6 [Peromyscus maniculatus bairdii]|uniref:carbonic anhydrase 6 n=1 Tax=Peromyscus maniculatus bairdii TaxID=230844 RepID=UPI00077D9696|nr:carbonic anhydrase 6 [Peromyscus maniculatus bairdii]
MRALVTVVSLFFLGVQAHWTYSGEGLTEDQWSKEYPACGGRKQSPIDLVKHEVTFNLSLKRLSLTGYGEEGLEFPMTNNGHTVQITLPHTMYITDSKGNRYISEQLHFHWGGGPSGVSGSEHTVDGIRRVMEIHFVHFSDKFGSFEEAQSQPEGLAVVAVFVEIEEYNENTYYSAFVSELVNITYPGQTTTLKDTTIQKMLPRDTYNYYTYEGSLTTPPCTENVKWFVFQDSVKLSKTQVERIENAIKNAHNETLHDGYRKTQPLNHRVVEVNFPFADKLGPSYLYLKKIDQKLDNLLHYAGPKKIKKRKHS